MMVRILGFAFPGPRDLLWFAVVLVPGCFAADVGLGFRRVRILGSAFPGPRDLGLLFPRPSATFGLAIDSLVRRCPRPWVRRASLVSPLTLDWGSAVLLWFRRRRRTGAVSMRLRRLGWFNRNLGLLGSPGLLPVEKAEVCVLIYLDGEESS
ncbi:hypothetical protein U1Q18_030548 [Sarracenia purpurea var. burkii]